MEHPRIWLFRDYFKKTNLKPPIIDVGGREKWKETKGYYILNIEKHKSIDIIANGEKMPFKDGSIGTIILTEVLEHCENPEKILKECWRVLKKNGEIIVSSPFFWFYHPDPNDYWRYTKDGLRVLMEKHGFKVIETLTVCRLPLFIVSAIHGSISHLFYSVRNIKRIGKFLRYPFSFLSLILDYIMLPFYFLAYKLERFAPKDFIYVTTIVKGEVKQ